MKFFGRSTPLKSITAAVSMLRLIWSVHSVLFLGISVLNLAGGAVPLINAWLIKLLFDLLGFSLQTHQLISLADFALLLLAQIIVQLLSALNGLVQAFFKAELGRRLELRIQTTLYKKLNSLNGLAPFEDPRFYDLINLGSQGALQGPQEILNTLEIFQQNGATLIGFGVVLFSFSPLLAGIVFVAAVPQIYIQLKMGHHRYDTALQNNLLLRRSMYYSDLLSKIQFAKEMRLFDATGHILKEFLHVFGQVQGVRRKQQISEWRWRFGLSTLETLIERGAFVLVAIAAFAGRLGLGDVTLYMSAVQSVQGGLSSIIFGFSSLTESLLFYNNFTELLALPQPLPIRQPAQPVHSLSTQIEFRNVSFRYSDQHPWVLREFNLKIPAGRCLSLVGENGAGKSTLVKLLTRLYDPIEGQILWNGIDIREYDPAEFRRHISAVLQDYVHYDLTAYENIAMGDVSRSGDQTQIVTAATRAGIHDKLVELPQGYDTWLSRWLAGDNAGVDLSGGEWQRIALARMFMRNADLFILDEPTAALDARAEYNLYSHYTNLILGRTSLIISHRFSTVKMADLIAVLEGGKITEYGSHEALLSLGGTYSRLYKMQSDLFMAQQPKI